MTRPFLKWAGGKARIVERIRTALPQGRRLIEPFVGSGALFLNTTYADYLLADSNIDLINVYRRLQAEGTAFIERCHELFTPAGNTSEVYYRRRAHFNVTEDPNEKATLFVYLNRHGYNGLCRYNASGAFNVPFGRYAKPYFPEAEMHSFLCKSRLATFAAKSFTATMMDAHAGDVIYCDPPYVPLSSTARFTSYSTRGFTMADQEHLAVLAADRARSGVTVVISNHDTAFTRRIYSQATHQEYFAVQRHISRNGYDRRSAPEMLAIFAPYPQ